MKYNLMIITPVMATAWLSKDRQDRPLRKSLVERLAKEMTQGTFLLTHQGIAIAGDGSILDGQHRLAAIVMSGVSLQMFVALDCSTETRRAIDCGATRNLTDTLKIEGIVSNASTQKVSALVAMLSRGDQTSAGIGRSQMIELAPKYWDAIEFSNASPALDLPDGLRSGSIRGVVARAYYSVDKELLRRFYEVLASGLSESRDEAAIISLRNAMMSSSNVGGGGRAFRLSVYRKTERALVAYLNGEVLKRAYELTDEAFPIPGDPLGPIAKETEIVRRRAVVSV